MTLTDLNAKRVELNNKVNVYRDAVIANDGTQAAKLEEVKTVGRDFANMAAAVKKDNPELTDVDLFSNPSLMSQVKIDEIRSLFLAAGTSLLEDHFSGAALDSSIWDIYRSDDLGAITVANDEFQLFLDDRSAGVDPVAGILSKNVFPVGSTLETRTRAGYSYGSITLGAFVQPGAFDYQTSNYLAPYRGVTWRANPNRSSTTITWHDENGDQGSHTVNHSSSVFATYRIVRVNSTTIEFYINDTKVFTLSGRQFANDYKVAALVSTNGNFEQIRMEHVLVTK